MYFQQSRKGYYISVATILKSAFAHDSAVAFDGNCGIWRQYDLVALQNDFNILQPTLMVSLLMTSRQVNSNTKMLSSGQL